jgi:hypothetical protein
MNNKSERANLEAVVVKVLSCYSTGTNEKSHVIIQDIQNLGQKFNKNRPTVLKELFVFLICYAA